MTWSKLGAIIGVVLGLGAILSVIFAATDYLKVRPVMVMELEDHVAEFQVVATSVNWIALENFEKVLKRGGRLTRRQCARYTKLAKILGIKPIPC